MIRSKSPDVIKQGTNCGIEEKRFCQFLSEKMHKTPLAANSLTPQPQ